MGVVDSKTYIKRMRRLCAGLYSITANTCGWLLVGMLSPNKSIWYMIAPIIILTVVQSVLALVAWIYEGE